MKRFATVVVLALLIAPIAWIGWRVHEHDRQVEQRDRCLALADLATASVAWSPEAGCMARHWDGSLTPIPMP